MATKQKPNEEEVDLGSLFVIIGRGFSNLFNFITSILQGIFHYLIIFLIFIKKHFVKFAIAGFIGGGVGAYFHFQKENLYASEMLLEPNFESTRQLYLGVNYFNNLIEQKEYEKISSVFKITAEEAESLKGIEISPIKTEDDIVKSFDRLARSLDTLASESYLYKDFKSSFTDYNYRVHSVYVTSSNKSIFSTLKPVILNVLENNDYFSNVVKLNSENLKRSDSIYRTDLYQIDSLNKVYMKVLLEEAKKDFKGTNIALGDEQRNNKELELYRTKKTINQELTNIVLNRSRRTNVVNVIADFQPVGIEMKGLENNYAALGFGLCTGLLLIILGFVEFNKYLENYKKNS